LSSNEGGEEAAAALACPGGRLRSRRGPGRQIYTALYSPEAEGIQLAEMSRYMEQLGFHAYTLRAGWSDLEEHIGKGRPIVVLLKKGRRLHFAVVSGLDKEHVWLNDPARKKPRREDRKSFDKQWSQADRWMLLATP
jgi:ABC-type bacteriocin/lantibiotic exporter with double-glycine peptidase domain